jgi:hypothetical protein
MKKLVLPGLILGAAMALAPIATNAQIRNDRGTFTLPGNGDCLIETNAHLNFTGGPIFDLNDGFMGNLTNGLSLDSSGKSNSAVIKVRKFTSNNTAHRFMLGLSYGKTKVSAGGADASATSFGLTAGWGIEKIYTPAERLNTYVGADVSVGFARQSAEFGGDETSQNAFGFGVRGFTGMDYYVLPKVYLGIELGYGLGFNHVGEIEVAGTGNDVKSNGFSLAPYVTPTFRLGYVLGCGKRMRGNGEPGYRSKESYNDEE